MTACLSLSPLATASKCTACKCLHSSADFPTLEPMRDEPAQPLAEFLTVLREKSGLTLRQVERASGDEVSNVYLSQLEHGVRTDPNPRILVALARVYGRPVEELFEAAGYVDAPAATDVDRAFDQVLADKKFQFGTRFKGELDQSSKQAIVELYERATGKTLLPRRSEEGHAEG